MLFLVEDVAGPSAEKNGKPRMRKCSRNGRFLILLWLPQRTAPAPIGSGRLRVIFMFLVFIPSRRDGHRHAISLAAIPQSSQFPAPRRCKPSPARTALHSAAT